MARKLIAHNTMPTIDEAPVMSAVAGNASLYGRFFENASEGFALYELLYDAEGRPNDWCVLEVNAAYTRHTGISADAIAGQCMSEFLPAAIPEYLPIVANVVATQSPIEFTTSSKVNGRHLHVKTFPAGNACFASIVTDISDHMKVEEAYREADSRFRAIFTNAGLGIALTDPRGCIMETNTVLQTLLGYTEAELHGLPFREITHPDDVETNVRLFREMVAGKCEQYEQQKRYVRKDGRVIWAQLTVSAIREADGTLTAAIALIQDITARKESELALHTANRRLALLSDIGSQLLASRDPQQVVETLCRQVMQELDCDVFFNFLVHDREEGLLHLNACAGIPAATARSIEWLKYGVAVCGCVAREGERIIAEDIQRVEDVRTEMVRSFGVQAYCCHPLLAHGEVIGTLSFGTRTRTHFTPDEIAMMKAVADQVAVAMERIRVENEIRASEHRLQQIIDILPVGVWVVDEHGALSRGNPAGQRIWGGAHLVEEKDLGIYQAWWTDSGKAIQPEEWASVRAFRRGETSLNEELIIQCFDGTKKAILNSAIPLYNGQDEIVGAIAVNQDITALKELDTAKDEFLGVLSHELQTPLTSMLGWTEMAIDHNTLEIYQRALPIIQRNARRQERLVNELLDMSKLLHTRLDYRLIPLDLGQLALQIVEQMAPMFENADRTLLVSPIGEPLPVLADPKRIGQCFEHLLGNALKYTPAGGTITVACRNEDEMAVLTVTDTGRGIAAEQMSQLFQPFRQVDRDEAAGGLGLGLAVVRGIVELHRGTVCAESAGPDRGSTFTMRLPLQLEPAPAQL